MSSQETEKTTPPHRYETTVNLGPDTPKENAEPPRRSYSGVTRLSTGATSKRKNSALNVNRIQDITNQSIHGTPNMERVAEWTVAGEKQKAHRQRQRFRKETSGRVTGSRKEVHQLRAVKRTADVFIGRMDNDVTIEEIKDYISVNFELNVLNMEQLVIKTDKYRAYKVTVNMNERDKLFNAELWPEDVIVDKFYNRRSKE